MLIEIGKVIVQDRIRKDFCNIDELVQDIKENWRVYNGRF